MYEGIRFSAYNIIILTLKPPRPPMPYHASYARVLRFARRTPVAFYYAELFNRQPAACGQFIYAESDCHEEAAITMSHQPFRRQHDTRHFSGYSLSSSADM